MSSKDDIPGSDGLAAIRLAAHLEATMKHAAAGINSIHRLCQSNLELQREVIALEMQEQKLQEHLLIVEEAKRLLQQDKDQLEANLKDADNTIEIYKRKLQVPPSYRRLEKQSNEIQIKLRNAEMREEHYVRLLKSRDDKIRELTKELEEAKKNTNLFDLPDLSEYPDRSKPHLCPHCHTMVPNSGVGRFGCCSSICDETLISLRGGFRRAAKVAGGFYKLLDKIGVDHSELAKWGDKIPPDYVIAIEKATGVSRMVLRPDIYKRESRQRNGEDKTDPADGHGPYQKGTHIDSMPIENNEVNTSNMPVMRE